MSSQVAVGQTQTDKSPTHFGLIKIHIFWAYTDYSNFEFEHEGQGFETQLWTDFIFIVIKYKSVQNWWF